MAFKRIGGEIKRKKKKGGQILAIHVQIKSKRVWNTKSMKNWNTLSTLPSTIHSNCPILSIISIGQTCQILQLLVKLTSKLFFSKPSEIDRSPSTGDNNSSGKDTIWSIPVRET